MIGRIAGRLIYRASDHVMIDVQGVGYLVYCSERTLAGLPGIGEAAALFTDLLVKEDLLQLMGFTTLAEKECYRLLLSVQGVGAKAALAILGTLGADGVVRALALGDAAAIKAAPGIGPKIAQRVINELKDKAPAAMALQGAAPAPEGAIVESPAPELPAAPVSSAPARDQGAASDALSALANLGYGPSEAAAAVAQAGQDSPEADAGALIRAALRLLAPKSEP
ncbi:MAG: Holliday junction branch migration protein RuvA [Mangrovicoccus sp.]|nr:Holliday junction branch migration protein RuvA [Mangrovicoccus sp.]